MTTENDRHVLDTIFSPILPGGSLSTAEADSSGEDDSVNSATAIELEGIKAAEEGATDRAIELFSAGIVQAPDRPSGYSNRAQARSLKGDVNGALDDLNKALSLCINDHPRKVAGSAYAQRGTIRQLQGDMPAAMEDYKKAAALGNTFAKQQLVANNPMAALCNKMLCEVMGKLQKGESLE